MFGLHIECVHDTDGRIIQKISWGKTRNVNKMYLSINCALLSKYIYFDLSFPIKFFKMLLTVDTYFCDCARKLLMPKSWSTHILGLL